MSTRPKIDFAEIKSRVSLEQVGQMLGLKLKRSNSQFRCSCPVHGGDDRTLAVTPDKGWFCHQASKGGDCIALYAHVKECNNYDAASALMQHFRIGAVKPPEREPEHRTEFQALDYLVHDHEAVAAFGLPAVTAKTLGIGFAPKGTLRGCVAIPIYVAGSHDPAGYIGFDIQQGEIKLPKEWHLPEDTDQEPEPEEDTNIVRFKFKRPA